LGLKSWFLNLSSPFTNGIDPSKKPIERVQDSNRPKTSSNFAPRPAREPVSATKAWRVNSASSVPDKTQNYEEISASVNEGNARNKPQRYDQWRKVPDRPPSEPFQPAPNTFVKQGNHAQMTQNNDNQMATEKITMLLKSQLLIGSPANTEETPHDNTAEITSSIRKLLNISSAQPSFAQQRSYQDSNPTQWRAPTRGKVETRPLPPSPPASSLPNPGDMLLRAPTNGSAMQTTMRDSGVKFNDSISNSQPQGAYFQQQERYGNRSNQYSASDFSRQRRHAPEEVSNSNNADQNVSSSASEFYRRSAGPQHRGRGGFKNKNVRRAEQGRPHGEQ
jgi:hypothetical protein